MPQRWLRRGRARVCSPDVLHGAPQAEYRRLHELERAEPAVIVTGGEARVEEGLEGVTEARFMRDELVKRGVDAERVWLEEAAKYTIQNGVFVRGLGYSRIQIACFQAGCLPAQASHTPLDF